jgi:hypothetical protein
VRRLIGWTAGLVGIAALARLLAARRDRTPPPASPAETLDEISRVLKIDDGVMRHMATRRPEGGPSEPMAVAAAIGDHVDSEPADALEEE